MQQASAQQQQLTEQLASSEALYHALFDNSLVGIFQIQIDGLFLKVNQKLVELFGHEYDAEIIRRKRYLEYFIDLEAKQVFTEFQENYAVRNRRIQVCRQDRSTLWGRVSMQFNHKIHCIEGVFIEENEPENLTK